MKHLKSIAKSQAEQNIFRTTAATILLMLYQNAAFYCTVQSWARSIFSASPRQ